MRASTFIFKRFRISSGQTSWRRKLGTIALTSAAAGSIGYLVQTNPPEKELAFLREKARLLKAGAAVCGQELGELFVNDGKEKISLESPQENASLSSENIVLKQTGRRLPDESRPGTASLGYRSGPEPPHRESTQDDIHGKVQNKYDLEPRSNAITNYLWSSEKPIEDLEAHIVKLQERRKRLCLEMAFIERWLSEQEAEYYNSPESAIRPKKGDFVTKPNKLFYVELLGELHHTYWIGISDMDWMIADSRKRIEQHRSREGSQGKVTWLAHCSKDAAQTLPTYALTGVKLLQENFGRESLLVEEMCSHAGALALDDADFASEETEDERVYNPVNGRMETRRESLHDLLKTCKQAREFKKWQDGNVYEIMRDAEQRVKQERFTGDAPTSQV